MEWLGDLDPDQKTAVTVVVVVAAAGALWKLCTTVCYLAALIRTPAAQ